MSRPETRTVKVAAIQMSCQGSRAENVEKGEALVRKAAAEGAQIILLPELFEGPYFCKDQDPKYFDWAYPFAGNDTIERFSNLAAELNVVLPISFFEEAGKSYFNSIAVIDADGAVLGLYRKSHIPDGPGYQEKYYFSPGDTGFQVWETAYGCIGIGICWDQWFPEAARTMALQGAEILFYPTAIGSEPPPAPPHDSSGHWQRVMQGHAGANLVPLVAGNRVGREVGEVAEITFYGSSFIADETGEKIVEANKTEETILYAEFDLEKVRRRRQGWGIFRDRRPDLYAPVLSYDGDV
ncbi:N-carbamoylputrescine amidase [Lacibacterium aquatile]|uniref:N-carbamoylputrescine amidase n=1 Tax=Lacibacterium aquatile TaxID=1168082 RepID=A0ABW5DPG9_9PROT